MGNFRVPVPYTLLSNTFSKWAINILTTIIQLKLIVKTKSRVRELDKTECDVMESGWRAYLLSPCNRNLGLLRVQHLQSVNRGESLISTRWGWPSSAVFWQRPLTRYLHKYVGIARFVSQICSLIGMIYVFKFGGGWGRSRAGAGLLVFCLLLAIGRSTWQQFYLLGITSFVIQLCSNWVWMFTVYKGMDNFKYLSFLYKSTYSNRFLDLQTQW